MQHHEQRGVPGAVCEQQSQHFNAECGQRAEGAEKSGDDEGTPRVADVPVHDGADGKADEQRG